MDYVIRGHWVWSQVGHWMTRLPCNEILLYSCLCDLIKLSPCFHRFLQVHHDQSSSLATSHFIFS